ncbi:MAG TPA: adenylate/guanylate cyclase domain-containing protein [Ignavibacteriaceae bacterium]|nr:adenylate/guanylate cyclase domain-containing protein [Ignavibacteriaceae bacterium]
MSKNIDLLIAEDENIIAKDISRVARKLGYRVADFVKSGEEVIRKAEEIKPDLILMDIMLQGDINGIQAAERIKNSVDVPIVFLTALADEETLQQAKITEPFGYILKPFDERTLHSSIEMALYKHKISINLRERTRELEKEKKRTDELLHNILPSDIVKELKEKGKITPREYKMVTLLFTDFQGFTSMAVQMPPNHLVDELNDIFLHFDAIVDNYGLEKLKTIGDSYMLGGGFPKESDSHALDVVSAAIEMNRYINSRNKSSKFIWKMRTGIHSGNVIAGVIGKKKFSYDVWGDTVNIASRMERYSKTGEINISKTTHSLIKDYFECEFNSKIELMGNKVMEMYFVKHKKILKKSEINLAEKISRENFSY